MDWATIEPAVVTAAAGAATAVTGAGMTLLYRLGVGQARIEQKLDDHLAEEKTRDEAFTEQLADMSKKLPNGELQKLLTKLDQVEQKICGGKRAKPYKGNGRPRVSARA